MRRLPIAAAAVLVLGACATVPMDRYYTLEVNPSPTPGAGTRPLTLKVRTFRTGDIYRQERIVRHLENHEVTYYDTHRWAAPLERMVTERTIEVLRAEGPFETVLPYSSPAGADLVLEGEILAFEEVTDAERTEGSVHLHLRLVDRAGDPVWTGDEARNCPVREAGPEGTVDALSRCLGQVLEALASGMREAELPAGD